MGNIFLKPNSPKLRAASLEISEKDLFSSQTRKIIEKMLKIAHGRQADNKKPVMVGLAASQIGIMKRIILVDIGADGKGLVGDLRIYINPKIIWTSKKEVEWYEGCFSTGKICGIVSRPATIKVKAFTPDGELIEEKYKGYIARIFQHEIDHLNGVLFMDHIANPDHLHIVEKDEFPLYRNKQAWKNWPKKYLDKVV